MDVETMQVVAESQIEAKFKIDRKPAPEETQKIATRKKELGQSVCLFVSCETTVSRDPLYGNLHLLKDKEKKQMKKAKLREKKEDKQGDFKKFQAVGKISPGQ
nr:hypothetical protein BaRGS_024535 [Batillaria attramentaria]